MKKRLVLAIIVCIFSICIAVSAFAVCTDNDGNDFWKTSSVVSENGTLFEDYCQDWHTVVDWICDAGEPKTTKFYCDFKCASGRCVNENIVEYTCEDQDGLDYDTASYLVDETGKRLDDYCYNKAIVGERICVKGRAEESFKRCDYECENGKCIEAPEYFCTDPDGADMYLRSMTLDENGRELNDFCETPNTLAEYICKDGKAEKKFLHCFQDCRNGACMAPTNSAKICESNSVLCYNEYIMRCTNGKWQYVECMDGCDSSGCFSEVDSSQEKSEESSSVPEVMPDPVQVEDMADDVLDTQPLPQNVPDVGFDNIQDQSQPIMDLPFEPEESQNLPIEDKDVFVYPTNEMDSDRDGLRDAEEIDVYGTSPQSPDSDNDGYTDLEEIQAGSNPLDKYGRPVSKDSFLKRFFLWVNRLLA